MFKLDFLKIIVTGGAGLYGAPISQALAEAGGTVIIADRNTVACEEKVRQLRELDLDVHCEMLDMGYEESVRAFQERVIRRFGKIDVLINNAVVRPVKDFWTSTVEQWEESLRVNAIGIHLCSRILSEDMVRRKTGNIINISSIYGIVGPTFPIYEGTKFTCPPDYAFHKAGVINHTRYLATLLAPNIRVNCLSLGGLLADGEDPRFVEQYSAHCPMGRKAGVDDVKGPIIFLASEASRYMTGHNLVVDGGWTAW